MTVPDWTLITVTHNSQAALERHWGGWAPLAGQAWVVVDNASTDDSVAVASRLGARVISLPKNVGFGAANNVGFAQSTSRWVAFVNPDVTPRATDLAEIGAHLDSSPRTLVSPQLVNADGSLQPNGRGEPFLVSKIRNRTASEGLVGTYLRFAQPNEVVTVEWLMGAVVAGTRSHLASLASLGPWDERFFVYYEDSDLGIRNAQAGGTSQILGSVRWIHGWARETKSLSWRAWKLELASMARFYGRYPRLLGRPPRRQLPQGHQST